MASKKLGDLIKEARVSADLTQEQLAKKIAGLSASDISMAERGKKDLTQEQLKRIAKATGVTQASLLNAAKGSSGKSSTAKKTSSTAGTTSMKLTATEKKLVELYRKADSETKKEALNVLKGEDGSMDDVLETIMDSVQNMLGKK
jgi:transcriptional regulator with XRE-family HTH domain